MWHFAVRWYLRRIMKHTDSSISKSQIDKAGRLLSTNIETNSPASIEKALMVLNTWRANHSFALNTITVDLGQKIRRIHSKSTPVRRLKRIRSIISKLNKESMRLTQMQDIGGCRAVVSDIESVYKIKDLFLRGKSQHELVAIDDYIKTPKDSGYRSLHLIYKFKSKAYPEYNGLQIEVQLRTVTQHAWATAVETVGAMSGQSLKSSEGEKDWLEFFKLSSIALEHIERPIFSSIVPGSLGNIARKLSFYKKKLHVDKRLSAYREALRATDFVSDKKSAYYLLVLLPEHPRLQIFSYSRKKSAQAFEDYEKYERTLPMYPPRGQLSLFPDLENYSGAQAVLVGAESFKSIRESYPNYYLDTKIFLDHINHFIKKYIRHS